MRHRTLLIIDDSPAIHGLVTAHLADRFDILRAYDGATGLAIAADARPAAMLLDLDLPGAPGLDVCRRLKSASATAGAAILVLSAQDDTATKVAALDAGACDYLVKPFDPLELAARINAALRAARAAEEASQYSMIDRLTGLFDRRYFQLQIDAELARSRRWGQPLGCMFIGIDDWLAISLQPAPAGTDRCVIHVGEALAQCCRRSDVACRFAEDEFVVLAPGADAVAMQHLAQRVVEAVQRSDAAGAGLTSVAPVRLSIGTSVSRFSTGRSLVLAARDALARARRRGGACIVTGDEVLELRLTA